VQDYVAKRAAYQRQYQEHKAEFGDVNLGKIPVPELPDMLALYLELQRWPGNLLWEGGLQDQPAWVWDLIDLAGAVYEASMEAVGSPMGGP